MLYLNDILHSPIWHYCTLLLQTRKLKHAEVTQPARVHVARKRFFLDSKPGSLTEEPTVLMGLSKVWGWKQPRSWILRGTSVRASGKAEPTRSSPPPSGSMRMRKFSFSHTSTKAHSHSSQQFLMHLNKQKHVPTKICCILFTHSTGTCFRNTQTSPYP